MTTKTMKRSETQHTPGPWRIERELKERHPYRVVAMLSGVTCPVARLSDEADARLIAAAPDMLEALKTMLKGDEMGECECQRQGFPRLSERWEMARAAIAKAEGKTP